MIANRRRSTASPSHAKAARTARKSPGSTDRASCRRCISAHSRTAYTFRDDEFGRIPYLAPGLVGAEKAERGKTPTDVWWNMIVPTNGKERTGYPTEKPLSILNRIVRVHSRPGDVVLDAFAGSGTTGEAAALAARGFISSDESEEAVVIARQRLASFGCVDE